MIYKNILQRYYHLKANKDWVGLETPNRQRIEGFKTKRIAKCYPDGRLFFTIGETQKGKRNQLTTTIREIIEEEQIPVIDTPTTDGRNRQNKLYVGFSLNSCYQDHILVRIIERVNQEIVHCS